MGKVFLIGLAGFVGTLSRYWVSGVVAKRFGETFPMGTLVVNLAGCFFVGLLFYLLEERFLVNQTARMAILIGFLGGFTTFSSFGLQTFTLVQDGEFGSAVLNITASNLMGLLLVWAGYTLANTRHDEEGHVSHLVIEQSKTGVVSSRCPLHSQQPSQEHPSLNHPLRNCSHITAFFPISISRLHHAVRSQNQGPPPEM